MRLALRKEYHHGSERRLIGDVCLCFKLRLCD
jgi:hypothetical protein